MFGKKKTKTAQGNFAPDAYTAVLRCSICTGEQVAGFRENATGSFHEIMLVRNEQDLDEFRKMYGVKGDIQKIY